MTVEMTQRAPLYAITDAYRATVDLLSADFDLADEDQANAVLDTLDQIGGLLRHKVESIAGLIRDLDLSADVCEAEAKRLAERAESRRKKAGWLRDYVLRELANAEIDRVETDRFTVRASLNPPKCEVTDETLVPPGFLRHIPEQFIAERWEVNRVAVNKHFMDTGEVVPGTLVSRSRKLVVS